MKKLKRALALAMAVVLSLPTMLTTGTGLMTAYAAGNTAKLEVSSD